jgi:fumarate reductase subunit C
MKIVIRLYYLFVVLLLLLVCNYFLQIVSVPQWLVLAILIISMVLFFTKTWFRLMRKQ